MWESISHISSPKPLASSNVEDLCGIWPKRTTEELILLALIMQQTSCMEVAQRLILLLIRWGPVLALPQFLIATAVFKNAFVDR